MPNAATIFMQKNALQNKLKASFGSSSNNKILHRNIMNWVSSFLWTGICVASTHRHYRSLRVHSMQMLLLMSSTLSIIKFPSPCHAVGYSYSRFVGPVSGPEREILVHDANNGGARIDYIAHPDYQFAYGVEDSETQVLQNRKETRNGDEVQGVYSVVDPDGTLRVVKYTADNVNGFQAEVITNGIKMNHGQNDDGVIKDNGGWHTEIGNKDENSHSNIHENDYEVHDQYDDDVDDENDVNNGKSKDSSKNSDDNSSGVYYDSNDNDNDDVDDTADDSANDNSEEYEDAQSEEVSDESDDD